MHRRVRSTLIIALAAIGMMVSISARAEVRLPALIGSCAVLQRDAKIRLWGWADPTERIRIEFQNKSVWTRATHNGRWSVSLGPYTAGGPYDMTISGEENVVVLRDILIGDVWLASGQSNMAYPVKSRLGYHIDDADREVSAANFPLIRLFKVDEKSSVDLQPDVSSEGWQPVTPQSIGEFSAVAYFFGRSLQQRYRVPVGLIQCASGGTLAEAWMSAAALKRFPEFHAALESLAPAATGSKTRSASPSKNTPTVLFNGMINPLTTFSIKGVIWYQGESNALVNRSDQYRTLFLALIQDWRRQWGYSVPFLFVQLPSYQPQGGEPVPIGDAWIALREAQRMALSLPYTGMATTIDLTQDTSLHPKDKHELAHRLVLAAAEVAYGENEVGSGPTYHSMQIDASRIRIRFSNLGSGLWVKGASGDLRGFEIAAADGKFFPARAHLQGQDIVVFNDAIQKPAIVRYGWSNVPNGNLYNREGLPAVPFRTNPVTR